MCHFLNHPFLLGQVDSSFTDLATQVSFVPLDEFIQPWVTSYLAFVRKGVQVFVWSPNHVLSSRVGQIYHHAMVSRVVNGRRELGVKRVWALPGFDATQPWIIEFNFGYDHVAICPDTKTIIWCGYRSIIPCGYRSGRCTKTHNHMVPFLYFSFRIHKYVRRIRSGQQRKRNAWRQLLLPRVLTDIIASYSSARDFVT